MTALSMDTGAYGPHGTNSIHTLPSALTNPGRIYKWAKATAPKNNIQTAVNGRGSPPRPALLNSHPGQRSAL